MNKTPSTTTLPPHNSVGEVLEPAHDIDILAYYRDLMQFCTSTRAKKILQRVLIEEHMHTQRIRALLNGLSATVPTKKQPPF
jgi:hypothetical protein